MKTDQYNKNSDRMIKKTEDNVELWKKYAIAGTDYYKNKNMPKALAEFKKALALKPDSFSLYFSIGSVYMDFLHYDKELAPFKKQIAYIKEVIKNWERSLELKEGDKMITDLIKRAKGRLKRYKSILADRADMPVDYDEMTFIPAESFFMGNTGKEDGRIGFEIGYDTLPQHEVFIDSFYIDAYEVSNSEYKKFIDATDRQAPNNDTHDYDLYIWHNRRPPEGTDEYPVSLVSWHDADAYCKWKDKRLPTEEEWEKAARGNDKRRWPWGDTFAKMYTNTFDIGIKTTMPVYNFKSGRSIYGVYNMSGNVSEWTSTWYVPYPGNTELPADTFTYKGKRYKIRRGSSFLTFPDQNWITRRIPEFPDFKHRSVGFRCAKNR